MKNASDHTWSPQPPGTINSDLSTEPDVPKHLAGCASPTFPLNKTKPTFFPYP